MFCSEKRRPRLDEEICGDKNRIAMNYVRQTLKMRLEFIRFDCFYLIM